MAELINPMICGKTLNDSFDLAIDGGVYSVADPDKTFGNNPGVRYGVLVVFEASLGYRMQLAINSSEGIWMRFFTASPVSYKEWQQLQIV